MFKIKHSIDTICRILFNFAFSFLLIKKSFRPTTSWFAVCMIVVRYPQYFAESFHSSARVKVARRHGKVR